MKIKKLNILNIQSLRGTTSIDFEAAPLGNAGIFAITGPTGAGKTTLLDGITLALYGVVHRSKPNEEIISYGAGEASAEILVENRGQLILSKWSQARARKKADGKLQPPKREVSIWVEDKQAFEIVADKINDANAQIAQLTGLDFARFTRSVLLAQGDFAAFLSAGAKERKDLLERITGTEIYTTISKAAHRRARAASEALKALNQELEHVGLKTEDELQLIKEELEQQEKGLPDLQKQLKAQQKIIEQYGLLEKAKLQSDAFGKGFETQQLAWTNFQPQLALLNNYRKVFPLKAQWEQRSALVLENKAMCKDRDDYQSQREQSKSTLAQKEEAVKMATAAIAASKAELPGVDEKIEQAILLEEQVTSLTKTLKLQRDDFGYIKQKETKLLGSIDHRQKQIKAWQEKQLDWLQWEKAHPKIEELDQDLPSIQSGIEKILFLIEEGKKTNAQIKKDQQNIDQRDKLLTAARKTLADQEAILLEVKNNLAQLFPTKESTDASQGAAALRKQFQSKIEQRANLLRYEQLVLEQDKLTAQSKALDLEIAKLEKGQRQATKTHQEIKATTDKTAKALVHAEDIYRQQLLIKNYERERANLKDDDPCPLCGAAHHPDTHELKAYVDESLSALQDAKADHETAISQLQEAQFASEKIKQQIAALTGAHKDIPSLKADLANRIVENADILLAIEKSLGLQAGDKQLSASIAKKIAGLDQSIRDQEAKMSELEQLEQQRSEAEKAQQNTQAQIDKLTFERKQLEESAVEKEKRKKEYKAAYVQGENTLNGLLQKYELKFDHAAPNEVITKLYNQTEKYKALLQHQKEHDKQVAVAENEIKAFTKQQGERLREMAAMNEKINELSAQHKKLQKSKQALIGDQAPSNYKANLLKKIQQQEEDLKTKEADLAKSKEKITVWQAKEKDLSQRIEKGSKNIKGLEEKLDQELAALGLSGEANFGNYFLEDSKVTSIELQRDQIKESLVRAEQNFQRQQKEIQALEAQLSGLPPFEEIALSAESLVSKEQQLQERMGALKQILLDEDKKGTQVAALRKKIKVAKAEDDRWEELRLLIGSAEGHKFSEFAQSITLNQLINLANAHLQKLSGRYIIEQHAEKPLSLNIIDTFQADNTRSMGSLSGGESFLVSLSLALGLSDLAGNRTQIQSLFIDEGFGSLDEQSLNLAIETLENLQSSGKTIGVISHVKELQERIATQIKVIAGSDGFGRVEVS